MVTTGRNRRTDTSGPPGQLAGGTLAHAEINALEGPLRGWATLLPLVHYPEHGIRGPVDDDYRAAYPELMALAARLVEGGHVRKLRALPLTEAFGTVGDVASHMPTPR